MTQIIFKKIHVNNGVRPCIILIGRKWLSVIYQDGAGLRVRRKNKTALEGAREVMRKGKVYPTDRAINQFLIFGGNHGMTKAAHTILKTMKQQTNKG